MLKHKLTKIFCNNTAALLRNHRLKLALNSGVRKVAEMCLSLLAPYGGDFIQIKLFYHEKLAKVMLMNAE